MKDIPVILGSVRPDPIGQILGTGFWRFDSPAGLEGLAKWDDGKLDILAVAARNPKTGQFRRFIRIAQIQFKAICIWEVDNPILIDCLPRYGFTVTTIELQGENFTVFQWERI